mmetsp:Transcript_115176/g.204144  ORF Transcript_115176/g.204144 Transcript_115176/m.204144 type:complete len:267 (+) Transcript_115176:79-879(+)
MQALASKIDDRGSVVKSQDTTSLSVYPMIPFMVVSEASFIFAQMSFIEAGFAIRQVRSTTDTSGVGTRKAMPVSLPFISGITLPTALAAPVDEGMMFSEAARPPRQSFPPRLGPSTVSCVAVMACTVVIRPSTRPKLSCTIFVRGARQLVVQEAFETTVKSAVYFSWLTPMTNMGTASLGGAEMITFLAPPLMCNAAFSCVVKTPVDSQMNAAPALSQPMDAGSFSWNTRTDMPFTTRNSAPPAFFVLTVPLNLLWTVSYDNKYCM